MCYSYLNLQIRTKSYQLTSLCYGYVINNPDSVFMVVAMVVVTVVVMVIMVMVMMVVMVVVVMVVVVIW